MRIVVDTHNSSLLQGTGIASYTRTLAQSIHRLGHTVNLLTAAPLPRASRLFFRPKVPASVLVWDHPHSSRRGLARSGSAPLWVSNRLYSIRKLMRMLFPALSFSPPMHLDGDALKFIDLEPLKSQFGHFDEVLNVPDVYRLAWTYFQRTGRLLPVAPKTPIDIAHFSWCLPIRIEGAKNVYAMHDLIPLRFPYMTLDDKSLYYRLAKACAETADLVVTISESSRRDIVSMLDVPEHKVVNTYIPFDISPQRLQSPVNTVDSVLDRAFGLRFKRYFLIAGSIEPRKNVGRTFEAFLGSATDYPLVICGPKNGLSDPELAFVDAWSRSPQASQNGRRVIVLDYLPRDLLLDLIQGARAVLVPSVSEGFGLTALEAMALGSAAVVARAGGLAEVCADAGIYVDTRDGRALREAFERISNWSDTELEAVGRAGQQRAKVFSPENFDARLSAAYASIVR